MALFRPCPLPPGGHIRVISPGFPSLAHAPNRPKHGEQTLIKWGFKVSYGKHAFDISPEGDTAGTAPERAADFMEAFEDPSVDAIISSDAGIGSREMLSYVDATRIAGSKAAFVGYCDNVFLNQFLSTHCGLSSYIGCCLVIHIGEPGEGFPETRTYFTDAVMGSAPLVCEPVGPRTPDRFSWEIDFEPRSRSVAGGWTWIRRGSGRGTLVGGEISIIADLVNDFDLTLDSAVLFWDISPVNDIPLAEHLERLSACADLSGLAGMIVGANTLVEPAEWAATVSSLLDDVLPGLTGPVVVNADLSHFGPSWIVPYGEEVMLGDETGIVFPRNLPIVGQRA